MREHYKSHCYPGRYEGVDPIVEYIDVHNLYDETSGDVDSPTGWFGRTGRWIISVDSEGFIYGHKAVTLGEARGEFATMDRAYSQWDEWQDG